MTTEIKAELITALGGKGISRPGLRRPVPRAKVARMIKRLFAVFSLLVIALPSLAAAQGVTSSADPRATEAGREILQKGGSAADAEMAMMLVLTLVEPQSSGVGRSEEHTSELQSLMRLTYAVFC